MAGNYLTNPKAISSRSHYVNSINRFIDTPPIFSHLFFINLLKSIHIQPAKKLRTCHVEFGGGTIECNTKILTPFI